MKGFFYRCVILASRLVGTWAVGLFAWGVCLGFYLFRPRVRANSHAFYRSVFPEKSSREVRGIVWSQFQHFATVFVDRVRLARGFRYECETQGMEAFARTRSQGRGGIFLMSHFGNWEIAARLFSRRGVPLMLHLGVKQNEQIEKMQKHDLARDGIRVASASPQGGSRFDLLESIRVLRAGGFVSIAGDRIQSEEQRYVDGLFFGRRMRVPVAPHLLALKTGVPIFTLFTIREKKMHYRVVLPPPVFVSIQGSRDQDEALRKSVDRYLAHLEDMVRRYPEHWYRFDTGL